MKRSFFKRIRNDSAKLKFILIFYSFASLSFSSQQLSAYHSVTDGSPSHFKITNKAYRDVILKTATIDRELEVDADSTFRSRNRRGLKNYKSFTKHHRRGKREKIQEEEKTLLFRFEPAITVSGASFVGLITDPNGNTFSTPLTPLAEDQAAVVSLSPASSGEYIATFRLEISPNLNVTAPTIVTSTTNNIVNTITYNTIITSSNTGDIKIGGVTVHADRYDSTETVFKGGKTIQSKKDYSVPLKIHH